MLKIHELTNGAGELTGIYLRVAEGTPAALEIVDEGGAWLVPTGALEKVLARYGAPFDLEARIIVVAELAWGAGQGAGQRLRHVRHLAGYDVVMRDYLVLDVENGEAWCAPGAAVAAALQHLGRAAAAQHEP